MRKYIFRGKRCNVGEWVTGLLWHHNKKAAAIYSDALDKLTWVRPETVGMYTGQLAQEAEVFEGDIIRYDDDLLVVEWDPECACFECRTLDGTNWVISFSDIHWGAAEIVGNVHDNPEMLEV